MPKHIGEEILTTSFIDANSLKIGGTEVIDSSRYLKNVDNRAVKFVVDSGGNGDYSDIASAITALPSTGGILLIRGTHTITSAIDVAKRVFFIGDTNAKIYTTTTNLVLFNVTTSGVRFYNLTFEGNGATSKCYGINLNHLGSDNDEFIIQGCNFKYSQNCIQAVVATQGVRVINNTFYVCDKTVSNNGTYNIFDLVYTGNYIRNPSAYGIIGYYNHGIIANNIQYDAQTSVTVKFIDLYSSSNNILVSHNTISQKSYNGNTPIIEIDGNKNKVVSNLLRLTNTSQRAILINGDNNLVTDNYIKHDGTNTSSVGITIDSGADETYIHGNYIEDLATGISDSGTNTKLRDNFVNGSMAVDS